MGVQPRWASLIDSTLRLSTDTFLNNVCLSDNYYWYTFSFCNFTEKKFSRIAGTLRKQMKNLKIEVVPWISEFVDMDKLYTELSLEKVENQMQNYQG